MIRTPRRAWDAIDAEASTGTPPGTAALCVLAAAAGLGVLGAGKLASSWAGSGSAGGGIEWAVTVGAGFGVPALVAAVLVGESPARLGLGPGRLGRDWPLYLGLFALALPGIGFASGRPEVAAQYPLDPHAGDGWTSLVAWLVAYGAMFAGLEVLFRGVLLFPLARRMGSAAIPTGVVPYVLVHLLWDKGVAETLVSIPFALLAGTLALYSRSIWGVWALHFGTAAALDLLLISKTEVASWTCA